ncbi:hypothetical protein [Dorea amylophila]|uniref:hypothetical protein n=1 Tax=Dorea amylophila TaxID=2981789 RepID=UPI0032642A98
MFNINRTLKKGVRYPDKELLCDYQDLHFADLVSTPAVRAMSGIIIDGYHRWMAARYLYELGSLHKIHCLYAGREDVLDYLKGKLDTMPQEEIA